MLCPHPEHDGAILFLITVWTLLSLFGAWWGDSLTRHNAPNDDEMSSLGRVREFPHHTPNDNESMVGRFSYLPQAGHLSSSFIACRTTTRHVQPGASKRISPPRAGG